MYETEAHFKTETLSQLPDAAVSAFGEWSGKISGRTLISWGEHCTECGWPTCYSTCDLYSPREDTKCRRFVDGMVRIDCSESVNGYLLKIDFKRWGKLWARGNFRFYRNASAGRLERRDYRIGSGLWRLPVSERTKQTASLKRYAFKKRMANRGAPGAEQPTAFLLECYNPSKATVDISLTIKSLHHAKPSRFPTLVQLAPGFGKARALTESKIPFQKLIQAAPGFNRVTIPFPEMSAVIDVQAPFSIDITPNEENHGTTLYFGAMDFIWGAGGDTSKKVKPVKCVVWDLDNTLWDGVLVEDGLERLRLKPGVAEVIRELDRRGILHSIASKNNHDEAVGAIKSFGLEEFFLYPEISWGPKSEGLKAISRSLNVGTDALLFIDDNEFELEEVKTARPEIRVLNAAKYLDLPNLEECSVPATAESASRRQMYQVEIGRKSAAENFGDDYLAFLKDCNIRLKFSRLSADNLDRVYELAQRTNQMNFSGSRYDHAVLREIMANADLDTYVMTCEDRFGSYGIIGFSIIDRREPRMTDLMFSCRIQSKRVEHTFLAHVIRGHIARSGKDFLANYRKTEKNAPSGKVFTDLGMDEISTSEGVSVWSFSKNRTPPDAGIINVEDSELETVETGPQTSSSDRSRGN